MSASEHHLASKAWNGMSWASISAVSRAILQFVVLAVLARVLSPGDYGVMSAALIVVGISTLFSQMGVGPALIQMKDLEVVHVKTAMTLSLLFGLATFSAVWLGSPLIESGFHIQGLSQAIRMLSFAFPIAAVSVVAEASLQRKMNFKMLCINDLSSYLLGQALVSIVLAYAGWGFSALVLGFLAQAVLRTLLMVVTAKVPLALSIDRAAAHKLFRFSFLYTFSQFANYVALNADSMIVGRYFGASGLGVYGRAYQIVVAPAVIVGDTLDKVFFPAVSRVQDSQEHMARIFEKVTVLLAFVLPAGCAMLVLLAKPIVLFLLGAQWVDVIPPLQVLSIALFFRTTPKFYNAFIKATGKVSALANYQLLYALCIIVFSILGAHYGMAGVAFGVLAALVTWWFFMTSLTLKITGILWGRYLLMHREGLVFTALLSGGIWACSKWGLAMGLPPLAQITISLTFGGFCSLGAIAFAPSLHDLKTRLIKQIIRYRGMEKSVQG